MSRTLEPPLLTPADTAVFDEDVIADMESHVNEVIPCLRADAAAAFRISMRCCGEAGFLCAVHRSYFRYQMELVLLTPWTTVACIGCGHEFRDATHIDEVVREVQL